MVRNTILITQARFGSTRLPGKVLKEINGKTLLQIHLDRLIKCKSVSEIIVANLCSLPKTVFLPIVMRSNRVSF